MDILKTMMFIHIAKNGGTTIETILDKNKTIMKRDGFTLRNNFFGHKRDVSPWHMTPEMYEHFLKKKYNTDGLNKRFCILRHPIDRYESCQVFSRGGFVKPFDYLINVYSQDFKSVLWDEELVHRMPQHMFLYYRNGTVQCDCAITIEKLNNITKVKKNTERHIKKHEIKDKVNFHKLYHKDFLLWDLASKEKHLCFQPLSFWNY